MAQGGIDKLSGGGVVGRKASQLLKVEGPIPEGFKIHTVTKGQSLEAIAKMANLSPAVLKSVNPQASNVLFPGDQLLVPPNNLVAKPWLSQAESAQSKKIGANGYLDLAGQRAAVEQQAHVAQTLTGATQVAAQFEGNGAGTMASLLKEAVRTRDMDLLGAYSQVLRQATNQYGGDEISAAKLVGAWLVSQTTLDQLPKGDITSEANLDQVPLTAAIRRQVTDITPKGNGAPTSDQVWSTVKKSVELGEAIVYQLAPGATRAPPNLASKGLVEAEAMKALHNRFPDALVDLVLMDHKPTNFGLTETGDTLLMLSHQESQMQGLSLLQERGGMIQIVPNEKVAFDPSKPEVTIVGKGGLQFLEGKASKPGWVTVEIGRQEGTVNTDENGNWSVPLPATLDGLKRADIVVTAGQSELYKLSDSARQLASRSRADIAEKFSASPSDPLFGGLLEKVGDNDWSNHVASVGTARLLNDGKANGVPIELNADHVQARSGGEGFFYREHSREIHAPFFVDAALSTKTIAHFVNPPKPWAPENFESNVLNAMGYVPERDANDPEWAQYREKYVKPAVASLNKVYAASTDKKPLEVTVLPIKMDQPDGQHLDAEVFRVETPQGPRFMNDDGSLMATLDEVVRDDDKSPAGTVLTFPENGKLELDAKSGLPKLATFVVK